jgi:hypothetical protein
MAAMPRWLRRKRTAVAANVASQHEDRFSSLDMATSKDQVTSAGDAAGGHGQACRAAFTLIIQDVRGAIAAPTGGTWSGVAMYQDPSLTSGVDIAYTGNSPTWDLTGLIYLPHSSVTSRAP